MRWIVDRFEGHLAVVETDDGMINIPLANLPTDVKEGDCLRRVGEQFEIDIQATSERRQVMEQRLKKLFG